MSGRPRVSIWAAILGLILAGAIGGKPSQAATMIQPQLGHYQLIRPVSATVRHGDQEYAAPTALYDGTGLLHRNPLLAEHSDDPSTYWTHPISADNGLPVSIEFDLGGNFLVNEMWMWQLPGSALFGAGVREFDITMRDEFGAELGTLTTKIEDLKAYSLGPIQRFGAFGDCVLLPFPDCVRFVEVRIKSNMGSLDLVGLAEVAFAGRFKGEVVPEPSSLALLALGSLVWIGSRRRRRI